VEKGSLQTAMEQIDIMDIRSGHETKYFNPDDKKDVNKMIKLVTEKIKDGYYFYVADKNGKYSVINDPKKIKEKELEKFLLSKQTKKRLITPPKTGG